MTDFIRVFCRSCAEITAADVLDFIREGAYIEGEPEIRVTGPESVWGWRGIEIRYDPTRHPITLWHDAGSELLRTEIAEIIEELQEDLGEATDVFRRLAGASCVYAFEIDSGGLDEDGWALLDCLESHLARVGDGLVYAPGDGIFDASLTRLHSVGRTEG